MEIERKLYGMVGNTYMYRNDNLRVLRYSVGNETTRIVTDRRDIEFANANAKVKLEELLPVDCAETDTDIGMVVRDGMHPLGTDVRLPEMMINRQGRALTEIVMRNIELIEKDPENIKKAAAINVQVKSFLDICKTEVEAMKVAAYVHKTHNG